MSTGSRIAQNTIFLYIRMICVMLISLYTVRVVLSALGADDYGIYQTVGGIVTLLAFVNNALGTGSSRFLTFELGKGVTEKLKQTFCTLLVAHIIIAIVILLVAEIIGMWYILNHFIVPEDKLIPSIIVFQFSIITAVMSMTQIPYTAIIIAHENLKIYAYMSLVEVFSKLLIAFFIVITPSDKLELYAFLLCVTQVFVMLLYRIYCYRNYEESHFGRTFVNFKLLRPVISFSSWSCFASLAISLVNQGSLIVLNMFFSPAVVAARSIAVQLHGAAQQLIDNFRTAANPQIIKYVAIGEVEASQKLLLLSTRMAFYLMLLVAIPVIILADPLLNIWLEDVPEYSVAFLQCCMIQSLFAVFDSSLYTALYAKGQLKQNALLSPTIGFFVVPLAYIFFSVGYSPLILAYLLVADYAILGLLIKPILICRIADYKIKDICNMFARCTLVGIITGGMVYCSTRNIICMSYLDIAEVGTISIVINLLIIMTIGLKNQERIMLIQFIKNKICNKMP